MTNSRYTLSDLVSQCDPSAPVNETAREWLDAPAVGREILPMRPMTDDEVMAAALSDPDAQPLTPDDFARMRRNMRRAQYHVGTPQDMGRRFIDAWNRAEHGQEVNETHCTLPETSFQAGTRMPLWRVDFTLWHPRGSREVEMQVRAVSSRSALQKAVARLRLRPGELFHSMHVHIGAP